jgi:hypothetical protein
VVVAHLEMLLEVEALVDTVSLLANLYRKELRIPLR